MVLLVLVVIASTYLLVAFVVQDQTVIRALRWTVAVLTGLAAGNLTLLVIALAVDRVMSDESPSTSGGLDEELTAERELWDGDELG